MGQSWERVLFAHWRVPAAALRRVVPERLPLDEFDGSAWIGLVPFVVRALRPRGLPPMPVGSCFPEANVRTYVTVDGRPGVYFMSLDAASRLAVAAARRAYRLPYFHARMSVTQRGSRVAYRSERVSRDGPPAALDAEYGPAGETFAARPGTLDHFLIERYRLYTLDQRRRIVTADIHHPPWPLQPAGATFARNSMGAPFGLDLPAGEALLHFAARQDVAIWAPHPVAD